MQEQDTVETLALFKQVGVPEHQAVLTYLDTPVLLCGFHKVWPRVYEAWTIFGKHWSIDMYPAAFQWTNEYLNLLEFDRVQHILEADREWMHKILIKLGFEKETDAPLKKFINGKDCHIYARFK